MQKYDKPNCIKADIFVFVVLVCFLRIAFDWAYKNIVSPAYLYMGFINASSLKMFLLSWGVLMMGAFLFYSHFRNTENSLSKEIPFFLFLLSFIPFTSLISFGMYNSAFIAWNLTYWTVLSFCTQDFGYHLAELKWRRAWNCSSLIGDTQLKIIAVCSIIIVLFVSGRYAHFRLNFNLLNVYDLRADANTFRMPTILSYAFSWTRMVNSILLAYFIRKKDYIWAIVCLLAQLFNFGIDGSKVTIFLVLFAVVINIIPKISMRSMNILALAGVIVLTIFCIGIYITQGSITPISLLVRRVFFVPARIQSQYFDFFTSHTPDFFRQSFLRYFGVSSPYPNVSLLIGREYSKSSMNANNGLISDAITNLGHIGILIMPLLLSIVLRLLDNAANGLDERIYITIALYAAITLTNSFLFTVLMTHGLLITMIILKLMKRDVFPQRAISSVKRIL